MSPRQSRPISPAARHGFTLVELLVVVLIIGILAAIALPRFLGQRTKAKNAAAQAAARHALVAARSYYTQNSESYAGLGPSELRGYESSLSGTEAVDGQTPGPSANPQDIWIGNGSNGNNPLSSDSNSGNTVVLCSVSRGDTTYCVKDASGVASYLMTTSGSVLASAGGTFSASGWSTATAPASVNLTVSYLVVGGGGAGGSGGNTGGGGGGGVLSGSTTISSQSYAVVVGDGGAARLSGYDGQGNNGGSSSALGFTALGGGGGGGVATLTTPYFSSAGLSGASGGGGASWFGPGSAGAGTQGNNGGAGPAISPNYGSGGGGGAGGVGGSGTGLVGGTGGAGASSSITGSAVTYGGGGGGGQCNTCVAGGTWGTGSGGGGNAPGGNGTNGRGGGGVAQMTLISSATAARAW